MSNLEDHLREQDEITEEFEAANQTKPNSKSKRLKRQEESIRRLHADVVQRDRQIQVLCEDQVALVDHNMELKAAVAEAERVIGSLKGERATLVNTLHGLAMEERARQALIADLKKTNAELVEQCHVMSLAEMGWKSEIKRHQDENGELFQRLMDEVSRHDVTREAVKLLREAVKPFTIGVPWNQDLWDALRHVYNATAPELLERDRAKVEAADDAAAMADAMGMALDPGPGPVISIKPPETILDVVREIRDMLRTAY